MRKLFAISLLVAAAASADEVTYRSIQSGPTPNGPPTPIYDHGIHGEGQIIAFLDTGVDYDSCYFAEADGSRPPINTRLDTDNVDLSRRKIVAYDFLYSCDQYPNAFGCDDPNDPKAYDNTTHGTLTAAAAVAQRDPFTFDHGDGDAPAAKAIVQDGGYIGGDYCSQRPGFGCPVNLTPILEQAYRQGARIHSNSWGDFQGIPPPLPPPLANYSAGARDIDAFVWSHPDMLVVFNTGNFGGPTGLPPASSLSAPGDAKNTIQVGGTRDLFHIDDNVFSWFSLVGPTRDGRIKPDLVAPAYATLANGDFDVSTHNCDVSIHQAGTSYSSPALAGAAALVRQYYTDGFFPTGVATPSNRFTPSAALLKATLIAAARRAQYIVPSTGQAATKPVPSYEQGFGFPVLGDALYFPGDLAKLRMLDVPLTAGLAEGESTTLHVSAHAGTPLKIVLVWTDPPGFARGASDPTPELVNDLDLRVIDPSGALRYGNDVLHPGQPDRLNNVEAVAFAQPFAGTYTLTISANHLGLGPRQSYALVVTGDLDNDVSARSRAVRH
ncbi:MAG TPA: S8 family serine peptidase [Thermoanaerobaculia bacterium]